MSIESHRRRLLSGPRPRMGSLSDWGWSFYLIACGKCGQKTILEYRVTKKGPNQGRIFYTCPNRNVSYFLSCFVIVCGHFSWWFWLKFLIWCCNFSGMALDYMTVGTRRKSMLSMLKNLLQSWLDDWWECTVVWCSSEPGEPVEKWSVYFSWNWSWNPYSAEVHCRFSLFSAI